MDGCDGRDRRWVRRRIFSELGNTTVSGRERAVVTYLVALPSAIGGPWPLCECCLYECACVRVFG